MNKIVFLRPKQQLTLTELLDFERKYSLTLPTLYKNLILKYNGGKPESDNVYYYQDEQSIGVFYSIKYGLETNTVEWHIQLFKEWENIMAEDHLPIARSEGGTIYAISLHPDDEGAIYGYFYSEGETHGRLLAKDLKEFLGGWIE